MMTREQQQIWEDDCMRWQGRILTGKHAHYCYDWDGLPIDETCEEWDGCLEIHEVST